MRLVMMFPGQGSQYAGMGRDFLDNYDYVRRIFQQASDILNIDMKKLVLDGDTNRLNNIYHAQVSIFVLSAALAEYAKRRFGMQALYAAGNSLGELTALYHAGAYSFESGLRLVSERARLMEQVCQDTPGGMLVVMGDDFSPVYDYVENNAGELWVSGENAPGQLTLSGSIVEIQSAEPYMCSLGYKAKILRVGGACHCPIMKSAADQWAESIMKLELSRSHIQVISGVTGRPYPNEEVVKSFLSRQLIRKTCWKSLVDYAMERTCDIYIEVGPGTVQRDIMRKQFGVWNAFSLDDGEDLGRIEAALAAERQLEKKTHFTYETLITRCVKYIVSLPANFKSDLDFEESAILMDKLYELAGRPSNRIMCELSDLILAFLHTRKILQLKGYAPEAIEKLMDEIRGGWDEVR